MFSSCCGIANRISQKRLLIIDLVPEAPCFPGASHVSAKNVWTLYENGSHLYVTCVKTNGVTVLKLIEFHLRCFIHKMFFKEEKHFYMLVKSK